MKEKNTTFKPRVADFYFELSSKIFKLGPVRLRYKIVVIFSTHKS